MTISLPALIIPDIHNGVEVAEALIARHGADGRNVVFLGDYFDSHDAGPMETHFTARWLKGSLSRSNRLHLLGNHDAAYFFNGHPQTPCAGWSEENQKVIEEIFRDLPGVARQLRMAVEVGPWLVSHAGFSGKQFRGAPKAALLAWADATKAALETGNAHPLLGAGYVRGGRDKRGGVLWCDFDDEFAALPGVHQIVGHTRSHCVRCRQLLGSGTISYGEVSAKESWGRLPDPVKAPWRSLNWCIDAGLMACATVTEAEFILHVEDRDLYFPAPSATHDEEGLPFLESAGLPVRWSDRPPAFVPWEPVKAFVGSDGALRTVVAACGKMAPVEGPMAYDLERVLRRLRQGRQGTDRP